MLRLNLSVGALSISDNTLALLAGSILSLVTSGAASLTNISVTTLTKPAFLFWVKNSLACSSVVGSLEDTLGPDCKLVSFGNKPLLTASLASLTFNLGPCSANTFTLDSLSSLTKSDAGKAFSISNMFLLRNCSSIAFSVPIRSDTALRSLLFLASLFIAVLTFLPGKSPLSISPETSLASLYISSLCFIPRTLLSLDVVDLSVGAMSTETSSAATPLASVTSSVNSSPSILFDASIALAGKNLFI